MDSQFKNPVLSLLEELVESQKKKVMAAASQIIPNITTEDILQPNDYPDLENNPYFRYEEGVLEGIQTVNSALKALFQER